MLGDIWNPKETVKDMYVYVYIVYMYDSNYCDDSNYCYELWLYNLALHMNGGSIEFKTAIFWLLLCKVP